MQGGKLKAGSATVDLVISGLRMSDDSKDILHNYMKENGNEIDVNQMELLTKRQDARTHTYKITIKREERDKVIDASFWPEGLFVRDYRAPRKDFGVSLGEKMDTQQQKD